MRILLVMMGLALGLGGCATFEPDRYPNPQGQLDRYPKSPQGQARARDAEREAARLCPTRQVSRRVRAEGTLPSDYECERPNS